MIEQRSGQYRFLQLELEPSRGRVTAVSNGVRSFMLPTKAQCESNLSFLASVTSLESQELEKLVATACRSNAAFFDTAERYGSHTKTMVGLGYGETEKLMQLMLSRAREAQGEPDFPPIVATKFTPTPWRTTAQSVVDACEMSCKNLGVDQIDLYQIHMPDIVHPLRFLGQDKPKDSIYWDGLADCYHRGLVKNVGCSNYGPTLVAQCQEALAKRGVPLASNQIGYSILGRHNGAQDTVDKCNELGVKVLAYFPFAMGLLTGKYSSSNSGETDTQNDGSLSKFKRSSLELKDLQRYAKGDGITIPKGGISPLLLTMESIAETRGKSVAQVALNYIISKGVIPIPGARTVQQVEDNIGAMGWRLTETEVAMLELESDKLGFDFDGAGFKRTGEKFVGYGTEKFSLN
jgi:pyridoxine 4-dehydrogenase